MSNIKKVNMNVPRSVKRQFPKVTKVFEAKTPVDVEVTKKDNTGGTQKDAANCAMARAVCREFKADAALIGLGFSYVIKGNTAIRYSTPESVSREITSFDRNHDFRPGKYALKAVHPANTLAAKRERANRANRVKRAQRAQAEAQARRAGKRTDKRARHDAASKKQTVVHKTEGLRVFR